jgi:DUF971 family protein
VPDRNVIPSAIRRGVDWIDFAWDRAGHVGRYSARDLRLACPCAACVDEMTGRPLLDPDSVPATISAAAIEPVGAYGIRIRWSDGHATGIYTYQMLRDRCPCPDCRR